MRTISSVIKQVWTDPPAFNPPASLKDELGLPDLVLRILQRQGIQTPSQARAFMDFTSYLPASPYELPGMEQAMERTIKAIKQGEKIGVWGDFDVDGQTATATLVAALRQAGAQVSYHVPVRGPESHGINLVVLQNFVKTGISLLITCDTGISEGDSIRWAQQHGVDVIVTDHHTLPEKLPPAFALINPQFLAPEHPLRPLPGVGTAYKFAEALLDRFGQTEFSQSLHDLSALGIVADIAELKADARYLTQSGIDLIRKSSRRSIQMMLQAAEINSEQFAEEAISFALAPRMNAMGRLADANPMVEFLLTEDPSLIAVTINQIEGLNARRKLLCDQVFQGALDQIERSPSVLDHAVLMLSHPEWPAGVVGIVASRLVNLFHKPVILFVAPAGERLRGSARSVEGIDITTAIRQNGHLLTSFGGHPMAAGLSLEPRNFLQFQRELDRSVEAQTAGEPLVQQVQIDVWLPPQKIDFGLLEALDKLSPFGAGNPPLVFASRDLHLVDAIPIGKAKEHLQVLVEDSAGDQYKILWWQAAGLPQPDGLFDLAYTARSTSYKGQPQIQLEWLDFRLAEQETITLSTKSRKAIKVLDYRHDISPQLRLKDLASGEVYAEGTLPSTLPGKNRYELSPNDTLILWSIPPNRQTLDAILKAVNPLRVACFGILPVENELAALLKSAARNIKQTLETEDKNIRVQNLAVELAVTETAAELLLRWFAARGDILLTNLENGTAYLTRGGSVDEEAESAIRNRLQREMAEIKAFRHFYQNCEISALYSND